MKARGLHLSVPLTCRALIGGGPRFGAEGGLVWVVWRVVPGVSGVFMFMVEEGWTVLLNSPQKPQHSPYCTPAHLHVVVEQQRGREEGKGVGGAMDGEKEEPTHVQGCTGFVTDL